MAGPSPPARPWRGAFGYLAFRVTNTPWQTPYKLVPPFQQVLVQGRKPVPGQVYNVTRRHREERDVANLRLRATILP